MVKDTEGHGFGQVGRDARGVAQRLANRVDRLDGALAHGGLVDLAQGDERLEQLLGALRPPLVSRLTNQIQKGPIEHLREHFADLT